MTISRLAEHAAVVREARYRGGSQRPGGGAGFGHAHFWERAMSRRVLVRRAAGAGGVAITGWLAMPTLARAGGAVTSAEPTPVPGNPALGGLHIHLPGENSEPAAITDLNGFVGIGAVKGAGTATLADGSTQRMFFDVDNRFMQGEFVGADGRMHHGTFAFT